MLGGLSGLLAVRTIFDMGHCVTVLKGFMYTYERQAATRQKIQRGLGSATAAPAPSDVPKGAQGPWPLPERP